jgi:hypothetical protein
MRIGGRSLAALADWIAEARGALVLMKQQPLLFY